ncbi:hypothetical protein DRF60_19720 [Chryseobacterium elymi]|uniref:Uncharacterized protein n=1 Tax=Chryseobacterium elymi TaxID=395936 RepID=A0A3D9D4Y4_9FLAO|nr:hypothetical protein [Chryseobacterium elymi]REC73060.1 hypothetical protein DRF60_19720 [Chryseobacterium elymi]
MKRMIIASLFLITACKEEKKETQTQVQQKSFPKKTETGISENKPDESGKAMKWLEKSIENYFKADLGNLDKEMQKITTKDYYDYKTDAMNVDMDVDGSLTLKEFQNKWKNKFDVRKAGVNSGFLISGQDWEEIKISKCEQVLKSVPLSESELVVFIFDIILSDEKLKSQYPVEIEVIKQNDSFLIANVSQEESENIK